MTNEEALSILHCPDTVGGLYSKKYGEALGMAMEALKREPCEDCISRQAVLVAIDAEAWAFCDYLINEGRNDEQKTVTHFAENLRDRIMNE